MVTKSTKTAIKGSDTRLKTGKLRRGFTMSIVINFKGGVYIRVECI